MKNIFTFDFSVNREKKTITVKRAFAANRLLVWDAFTKSELLDQWWAPEPWKARTKSMDFKEGGSRFYAMVGPNGEEHWAVINYKTIEKPDRFTAIDAFTDARGELNKELPGMHWEVNFSDHHDQTMVEIVITFDDLTALETIIKMGFQVGFTMALQGLDTVLAGHIN